MLNSKQLHNIAMGIMENLIIIPLNIRTKEQIIEANKKAFDFEKRAADLISLGNEPDRSILYRSAAWMAFNAEMYKEAKEMVDEGLKGATHAIMIEELNDVNEKIKQKLC
jgi:cytolysin (calcineurin-like family phosphatase)